jgi:hypothetical protein
MTYSIVARDAATRRLRVSACATQCECECECECASARMHKRGVAMWGVSRNRNL